MQRAVRHAFVLALLLAACGDEESSPPEGAMDAGTDAGDDASVERQKVTLRFEARVGDEPFDCTRTYRGVGTSDIEVAPSDLRLFVSDVALIDAAGNQVPVELEERADVQRSDVALLDFETNAGSCVNAGGTADTNHEITGFVPAGEYVGVAFTNGVPEEVNHDNPIDLTAPLTAGAMHWSWLGGFLFVKAQLLAVATEHDAGAHQEDDAGAHDADAGVHDDAGAHDADAGMHGDGHGDGHGDAPGGGLLHLGSSECVQNQGCKKGNRNRVVLAAFDAASQRIVLDVARLFAGLDLAQVNMCHAVGEACPAMFAPLGVDYASGVSTSAQTLYHVE